MRPHSLGAVCLVAWLTGCSGAGEPVVGADGDGDGPPTALPEAAAPEANVTTPGTGEADGSPQSDPQPSPGTGVPASTSGDAQARDAAIVVPNDAVGSARTGSLGDGSPDDGAADEKSEASGDARASGCGGGWTGRSSADTQSPTPVRGYGSVQIQVPTAAQILGLHTVLAVPAAPPPSGTLFLWPGLQPLPKSTNFSPIGNGVLQPVLTWGGTCAPTAPSNPFASWWISAQYVNTYAKYMGHTGCNGGQGMDVAAGDSLDITMSLTGTVWKQVVVDVQTGKQATYDIDMLGQSQDWAIFSIEGYNQESVADVVFTSTTLTMSAPQTSSCQPNVRGTNDYFATPTTSSDGLTCCISRIILRSQGVAATSPDVP